MSTNSESIYEIGCTFQREKKDTEWNTEKKKIKIVGNQSELLNIESNKWFGDSYMVGCEENLWKKNFWVAIKSWFPDNFCSIRKWNSWKISFSSLSIERVE